MYTSTMQTAKRRTVMRWGVTKKQAFSQQQNSDMHSLDKTEPAHAVLN